MRKPKKVTPDELRNHACEYHHGKRWLYDARGIEVAIVCDLCEDAVRSKYRPEVFTDGGYETDEPIDPS